MEKNKWRTNYWSTLIGINCMHLLYNVILNDRRAFVTKIKSILVVNYWSFSTQWNYRFATIKEENITSAHN